VWWPFREPSLCRHVRRELLRNAWLDFTSIIPATACQQRNYVEICYQILGADTSGHWWAAWIGGQPGDVYISMPSLEGIT